eukprot:m.105743 g.105743  ORF g.105743 m.105743 type:complete len:385 (-) comp18953_c0_seq2:96-1250(-)
MAQQRDVALGLTLRSAQPDLTASLSDALATLTIGEVLQGGPQWLRAQAEQEGQAAADAVEALIEVGLFDPDHGFGALRTAQGVVDLKGRVLPSSVAGKGITGSRGSVRAQDLERTLLVRGNLEGWQAQPVNTLDVSCCHLQDDDVRHVVAAANALLENHYCEDRLTICLANNRVSSIDTVQFAVNEMKSSGFVDVSNNPVASIDHAQEFRRLLSDQEARKRVIYAHVLHTRGQAWLSMAPQDKTEQQQVVEAHQAYYSPKEQTEQHDVTTFPHCLAHTHKIPLRYVNLLEKLELDKAELARMNVPDLQEIGFPKYVAARLVESTIPPHIMALRDKAELKKLDTLVQLREVEEDELAKMTKEQLLELGLTSYLADKVLRATSSSQ